MVGRLTVNVPPDRTVDVTVDVWLRSTFADAGAATMNDATVPWNRGALGRLTRRGPCVPERVRSGRLLHMRSARRAPPTDVLVLPDCGATWVSGGAGAPEDTPSRARR
jgi:hypothetical protein